MIHRIEKCRNHKIIIDKKYNSVKMFEKSLTSGNHDFLMLRRFKHLLMQNYKILFVIIIILIQLFDNSS